MTDKVNAEVPALYSGKIVRLLANEDETVDVGTPICEILIESNQDEVTEENTDSSGTLQTDKSEVETKQEMMKNRYSPAVLTLAQEHQINLSELTGTGLSGRITRKDVMNYLKQNKAKSNQSINKIPANITSAKKNTKIIQSINREIPVTGIRKAIATNMVRSKTEIPHAWMMIEVDVTNLVAYRNAEKINSKNKRVITYRILHSS